MFCQCACILHKFVTLCKKLHICILHKYSSQQVSAQRKKHFNDKNVNIYSQMYFIFIHDNYFCHTSSQFQNETPVWRILANSAAASCQQQCRRSWRGWQLCSGFQLPSECGAGPSVRGFMDKEGASCSSYFRPGGRLCVIKQKLFVMVLLLKS